MVEEEERENEKRKERAPALYSRGFRLRCAALGPGIIPAAFQNGVLVFKGSRKSDMAFF